LLNAPPSLKDFFSAEDSLLKTRIFVSGSFPEIMAIEALQQWGRLKSSPGISAQILQEKKRKFISEARINIEGGKFRVKFYSYRTRLHHLLENFFYQSEAMRNFQMMLYFNSRGLLVPRPLVLAEGYIAGTALESVLIMEDLGPAQTYKELIKRIEANPVEVDRLLKELILSLAQYNQTGIYTLDVDKNILIKRENGHYQIYHFDFDNVFPFRKNNPRRAGRSLAFLIRTRQLYQKLPPGQISELIDLYLEQIGKKSWKPAIEKEIKTRLSKKSGPPARAGRPD